MDNRYADFDEYGALHFARHLVRSGRKVDLYRLIDKPWMSAQFKRFYSYKEFANDVTLLIEEASTGQSPNLVELIRGQLILATLNSLATQVPPELWGMLVCVGKAYQSLGFAFLIEGAKQQGKAYYIISDILLKQGHLNEVNTIVQELLTSNLVAELDVVRILIRLGNFKKASELAILSQNEALLLETVKYLVMVREFEQSFNVSIAISSEAMRSEALFIIVEAMTKYNMCNESLEIAKNIVDDWHKIRAIICVANSLIRAGKKLKAIEVTEQAWIATSKIRSWPERDDVLCKITYTLTRVGMIKLTGQAITMIKTEWGKERAILGIVVALAETGNFTEAKRWAYKISASSGTKRGAFIGISYARELIEKFGKAEPIIINMELVYAEMKTQMWERVAQQTEIALNLVNNGELEKTAVIIDHILAKVGRISNNVSRASALSRLAFILLRLGRKNESFEIVDQALETVGAEWNQGNQYSDQSRIDILIRVSQVMADAKEYDKAVKLANRAFAATVELDYYDWIYKTIRMSEIALIFVSVEREDKAIEIAEQALTTATKIQDEVYKTEFLILAAVELLQFEKWEKATKAFEYTMNIVKMLSVHYPRQVALRRIAQAMNVEEEANQDLTLGENLEGRGSKARQLHKVTQLLTQTWESRIDELKSNKCTNSLNKIAQSMSQSDKKNQAIQNLWVSFTTTSFKNRMEVFDKTKDLIVNLATLDQGETLWSVCRAMINVDSWW
ncbi:lipopolysaccharide assembly protein LapB [Neptuniibacter sp.]|uniref:tetratricopeptide repeat protein n=1 Tax=Neptuniibacter sp. TaxID=1962643 RepID=UPI00260B30E0|nr:tetratricopeptide repeat protein [Neptuniibacter sp.]MCP4594860.1 hypothetical protein [Neptuniibacter sp.]